MKESKIDLNERKIRNGVRKQKAALEKQMWGRLLKKCSSADAVNELEPIIHCPYRPITYYEFSNKQSNEDE